MALKNHTSARPWQLTSNQSEVATWAAGTEIRFYLKDIPAVTRRMANYLVGFVVTFLGEIDADGQGTEIFDWQDLARAIFASVELQQTMFGTPISANHYTGAYMSLFGFIGNGLQEPWPEPHPIVHSTLGAVARRHSWFVPLACLSGMKGHHTAQLACCYDKSSFIIRCAAANAIADVAVTNAYLKVSAVLLPEPEVRMGAIPTFVTYRTPATAAGTIIQIDSLGNSSSLEGVDTGAGIAWLAWMSSRRGFGGAGLVRELEYLNVPWRDLQQTQHLDAVIADYLTAAAHGNDIPYGAGAGGAPTDGTLGDIGSFARRGHLYGPAYYGANQYGMLDADFLPVVSPRKFLDLSKIQSVQGSQTFNTKTSGTFSGEHVFAVEQIHSATPAKMEDVLRKAVDSGVVRAVWGTNDVEPKVKVASKQPADTINPAKTRYFPTVWTPRSVVSNPPTQ